MSSNWRHHYILSLIFVTAFCSYAYELVLAQLLSILWGDVVQQYTITTGIYIASMGIGAMLTPIRISAERTFLWIEIGLSLLATSAPFFLVGADVEFPHYTSLVSYSLILAIGFLSGMELPLLLRILKESHTENNKTENALFLDYLGMFFAGLLFAIFFNRYWGTLKTSILLAYVNILLGVGCAIIWSKKIKEIRIIEAPIAVTLLLGTTWFILNKLHFYQEQLEQWVIGK